MAVVEAVTVRFCLFHGCQKGGGNCPAFGWHSLCDTSVSAGRIRPCAGQFSGEHSQHRPEPSTDPNFQSSGMAGPRLEPDPAAKESLSPLESRMRPGMPEQVGAGGAQAFLGAAGTGSGGQAVACVLASWGGDFPVTCLDSVFLVPPLF